MFNQFINEYKSTLKSSDTEEHIDLGFYRPIGFVFALIFRKMHITPNAVTIASIIIGSASGVFIYPQDIAINMGGMALLILANSLDSADGQLARLTGQYSRLGRILDGIAGDFWFLSIYVAICLRSVTSYDVFSRSPWLIWALALTAGICHARQAAMADYYRQFHLFFVKKDFPTELEQSDSLLEIYRSISFSQPFRKIAIGVYYLYTRSQESAAPAMQLLLKQFLVLYPSGQLPARLVKELRGATLPLCKWENFLTFNWRSITLLVTLLAGCPFMYFIIELTIFNAVLIYLNYKHERICRRFLHKI